ncbi:MAG: hypothetical protein AAF466_10190 [Bacteroidota bacterium]
MENKLFAITPQYSSFVDDQVLTSHQLNEFIEYFKEQDHLTRVCLNGVGIVCGFDISVSTGEEEEETTIIVTQGCGITTDGDLIKLHRNKEGEFDKSTKDSKELITDEEVYAYFKPFTDERAEYGHFDNGGSVIDLVELIPQSEGNEEDSPISELDLEDKVVILYLENYQKEPSICTGSNCDNQGQENVQNLKVLLASKDDVENVVNANDPIFTKYDIFEALSGLPETAIPKVVLNSGTGTDNNTNTYGVMADSFEDAITTGKTRLHGAMTLLFDGFGELLDLNNGTQNTVLNQIDTLDDGITNPRIQYRYDLVRDLSDTYNEILKLLLKLRTECCPSIEAFPKHLLLGCLNPTQQEYPELRHQWYPSPTNTEFDTYVKLAQSLARRIVYMLDNFSISQEDERIAITPSKHCSDLGEKAIPIYYDIDRSLLRSWDFFKTENLKQFYNLSYHRDVLEPGAWVQTPLEVTLDCYDFYRIEGHFGRPGLVSRDYINDLRNDHGLDFDCMLFDLSTSRELFTSFVKRHPSLEHKAGVKPGGTFVMVAVDDEVVADFSLSYKVAPDATEQGCCSLMECTFPWISSLKYMNNLSRSLLGTQSRNKPMPENYVLQVIEYRINGERLINSTTTLRIPLQEIFLRRMHAVTEALNNRFDKGVVFDFNESQKRFVITRAKEDTFVIRLREISMANNNAIYTYSNNGMFRNNRVFRADAMRCRDLKGYNPTFYEKLHDQIAPVNKDDDYGYYNEKWRKWTYLTERLVNNDVLQEAGFTRMITNFGELTAALENINLSGLINDFDNVVSDKTLNFHIDGDWVNGTWVNDFMLTHHRQNSNNTHDNIVLFVNLRKQLHHETGVTKMSIYIDNQEYTPDFDAVLEQYKTIADIYFSARPTGANAFALLVPGR